MGFKKIHKWSFRYFLLKAYSRFLHNNIFYKKVHIHGTENIPGNEPLIFTANHQNALMDALAIVYATDHQPVFLARSDIFSNRFIASLMRAFKIMPVYRIRDGMETLGKNEEIFKYSIDVLKNKKRMAILPEGNHGDRRKLRALKKGVARIAFMAEKESQFKLGLKIVPVGIDYSNYTNFRNSLFLNIGKPFQVNEFKDEYLENPKKAYLSFNNRLKQELSKLMIDIQNDEYYDTYYRLREIYNEKMRKKLGIRKNNLKTRFLASKSILKSLDKVAEEKPDTLKWFKTKVDELYKGLNEFNIRYWVLEKKKYSYLLLFLESLLQFLFLPVHIFGMITNYLPYKIPVWITNKLKDKQFVSSFNFGLMLVVFVVFYAIEFGIFAFFAHSGWIRALFLVSLPLAGFFTIENWILFKKLRARWIYNFAQSRKNKKMKHLIELRSEIIQKMDDIT